jgi:cytochrome c6
MKKGIVVLTLLAFVWACSSSGNPESVADASAAHVSQEPDGEKIYKNYCVLCHGIRGNMGASGAHDLTQSELSLEERVSVITNGRNMMQPFKSLLDPEEIEAVASFTLTLKQEE